MTGDGGPTQRALGLLRSLGAADLPHPGGTLLAHLCRVEERLGAWGARPQLRLAGLCHAFYGTDGFAETLLPVERRGELAAVIGEEAEDIVHRYAACERRPTYRTVAEPDGPFHDRFTGTAHVPGDRQRRDFAELTVVNELDIAREDPAFARTWAPALRTLFTRLDPLLTPGARADWRAVLPEG